MTHDEQQKHEERLRNLSDAALRSLVTVEQASYLPEVLELAQSELLRRRQPLLSPEEYSQKFPDEWLAAVGMCLACWAETTDETIGTVHVHHIDGTLGMRFFGYGEKCPTCGSMVQTRWYCLFSVVPLIPLGKYRVIHYPRVRCFARRLKKSD